MKKRQSIYTKDVILVMAASFFFMFSVMFVTPLINGYAISLGASAVFAGIITGIMSVVSMFLRPVAGNLTDRFSKYSLSFIGGVLILIGVAGYCFSPSGNWLLLFRLINGTGFVLATVCMTTWLAFLVPRSHVGEAMGFYGLMNALAMALAPALAINLYKVIGYKSALWLAVLATILMIVSIQFVGNHAKPKIIQNKKRKIKIIQKDALPVAMLTTFFAIPYFITQADIVVYVERQRFSIAVGYFFVIYAIALLLIRIVLKKYFDLIRFGIWFWLSLISMILFLIIATFMVNNWLMGLAAIMLSIGYGVIYSVNQSTALMLAPIEEQGLASSTFYLGLDIGMAAGPMIGGVTAQNLAPNYFYPVLLIIVPIILIIYFVYRKKLNGALDHH
ncbi:major facilitator superfamily transporter permease [Lactobacillus taiwanensis DSM 21401]|uniref:MFS transporter n=2 Tax=Lactobacillus taiwanensis TaxID=508451 RepID=A0A256LFY4_9LACO|nr:MFS transporter [Lactobacillus taiwanensis]KRM99834.1 major facilitator superfamily transporter permease [Lactobacillus taiwanensis DSM 21401]MCR1917034.1 MFS transporter [Lactobacillus taiwanensis]OYR88295.1 MFS transporter [Lactobacillus taiwanensis]OYR90369.1 MFS transporter [Lactobacillus taiwanensis]OYR92349.1 MFS transporter [Lactobacillus taiwanensis]